MSFDLHNAGDVQALAEYVEARRCVEIFASTAAKQRPTAAWDCLVLGWPVAETVNALDELPAMPRDKSYPERLRSLRERYDIAEGRWRFRLSAGTKNLH